MRQHLTTAADEIKRVAFDFACEYFNAHPARNLDVMLAEFLTTFSAQVRRDALEEAATLCENDRIVSGSIGPLMDVGFGMACRHHSKAIRALSPSPVKAAMASQWRDISTAPKDGRFILIAAKDMYGDKDPGGPHWCINKGWWEASERKWITGMSTHYPPLFWQEVPDPPSPVKAGGETP